MFNAGSAYIDVLPATSGFVSTLQARTESQAKRSPESERPARSARYANSLFDSTECGGLGPPCFPPFWLSFKCDR